MKSIYRQGFVEVAGKELRIGNLSVEEAIEKAKEKVPARFWKIHVLNDQEVDLLKTDILKYAESLKEPRYPEYILEAVRQNLWLEPDDKSMDFDIAKMSRSEVLNRVAMWSGLVNYGRVIQGWAEDIYNVKLNEGREG